MINPVPENSVRSAVEKDRHKLADLIHYERHVHRHLDWRPALDWIGYHPYLIAEQNNGIVAALALPPDPPGVAWIRLFAVSASITPQHAWDRLWPHARRLLGDGQTPIKVAAIPLHTWFRDLLGLSDFAFTHEVVVLSWRGEKSPRAPRLPGVVIRQMRKTDLPEVEQIDGSSFADIWRNSRPCLEVAFNQSLIATVAEVSGRLVGYQMSSATATSAHLARLAVHPDYQGRGIGYAIVSDLLEQFERRGTFILTVNTQHNNLASLALYKKAGFRLNGEVYPVYEHKINPVG